MKIRRRITDFFINAFCKGFRLLSIIPLCILGSIFGIIAVFVSFFVGMDRKVAATQIRFALMGSSNKSNLLCRLKDDITVAAINFGSFFHVGYSIAELLKWRSIIGITDLLALQKDENLRNQRFGKEQKVASFKQVRLVGADIVRNVVDSGVGCVALAGHIGNFELLAAMFANLGPKLTIVARSPQYTSLHRLLDQIRMSYGLNLLWREDSSVAKKILVALKSGHIVALLIDQDTKLPSVFSEFFGLDAATPIGPIKLAIKARVPLFTSFICRTSWNTHEIIINSITVDYSSDSEQTEREIIAMYNRRLEDIIKHHPCQWLWWHRRWRRRPDIDYHKMPEVLLNKSDYVAWLKRVGK